jgi:cytochrome c oxidase subunit 3/cytochrome o ubiquinol oxidase subunit 3
MTSAAAALPVEPTPGEALSRGRVGMIGLIVAETSLIAVFVVAYLFYIGKSLQGPYPEDVLETPLASTLCLLSSSATIAFAVRALRAARVGAATAWLALTIALGGTFLLGTATEWRRLILDHGLTISTNLFGTTFFSLVGLHASHVAVGLVMLLLIFGSALRGALRPAHAERFEVVSWYWHFVDAVWVVVFTVVYWVGG